MRNTTAKVTFFIFSFNFIENCLLMQNSHSEILLFIKYKKHQFRVVKIPMDIYLYVCREKEISVHFKVNREMGKSLWNLTIFLSAPFFKCFP